MPGDHYEVTAQRGTNYGHVMLIYFDPVAVRSLCERCVEERTEYLRDVWYYLVEDRETGLSHRMLICYPHAVELECYYRNLYGLGPRGVHQVPRRLR